MARPVAHSVGHKRIAAGNHNILDFRVLSDVGKSLLPCALRGTVWLFAFRRRAAADKAAARAVRTVDRTDTDWQKKHFVRISVSQERRTAIPVFIQRVIHTAGMIFAELRTQRQELSPQWIILRSRPIDQRKDVGRDPNPHWYYFRIETS